MRAQTSANFLHGCRHLLAQDRAGHVDLVAMVAAPAVEPTNEHRTARGFFEANRLGYELKNGSVSGTSPELVLYRRQLPGHDVLFNDIAGAEQT